MRVKTIIEIVNGELITGEENLEMNISFGCGADLMSDVMAYVKESVVLLTGLVSPQVIRTAEMMDIKVILFVRGKSIPENIIELAKEKEISIITTKDTMFTACGKLYSAGVYGEVHSIGECN